MTTRDLVTGTALGLTGGLALPMFTQSAGHIPAYGPPLPSVAPYFGVAPQNCPIANSHLIHQVHATNPYLWVGAGALRGNSGWYIANRRLALGFGSRTRYGYPQKVFWQLINGSHGPVTLTGWNLKTGERIWFGRPLPVAHPKPLVPPPVIAWPSGLVRDRFVQNARTPTLTFVPSTGSYLLHAQWRGGSWTIPFTAGG